MKKQKRFLLNNLHICFMKAQQKYTLNDFDLLVAKASFLFQKKRKVEKEQQDVINEITQLLVDNNLSSLTTSCGQLVRLQNTFSQPISSLPFHQKEEIYQWCKERDLVSINNSKLLAYISKISDAPTLLKANLPRAKFISQNKPVSVLVDIHKETEKSVKNTTPEARKAHMKDLRDSGLTFAQIGKIYRISSTHVSRILKKKDDIQKIRNGSVIITI